jgi:hypothetical protein
MIEPAVSSPRTVHSGHVNRAAIRLAPTALLRFSIPPVSGIDRRDDAIELLRRTPSNHRPVRHSTARSGQMFRPRAIFPDRSIQSP